MDMEINRIKDQISREVAKRLVQLDFPILTERQNKLLETYINKKILRGVAQKRIKNAEDSKELEKWKRIYQKHKYLHFNTSQRSSIHKIKNKLVNHFKTNKEMIRIIKNNISLEQYLEEIHI
jgi:hypothetical protein